MADKTARTEKTVRTKEGEGGGSRDDRGEEAGFVLAAVLLTLLAVGALATAGFVLTRTDVEISVNHRSSVEAGSLAERGIQRYLVDHDRPGGDTVYAFGGDTARVSLTRLLEVDPITADTLLRIESEGVRTLPGGERARRTVSRILVWGGEAKPFTAAAAAGKDMDLHDKDPELSGADACGAAADVAGASVTPTGWHDHPNQQVFGSPPVDSSYAVGAEVLRAAGFDSTTWAGLRAGDGIWPDVVIADDKIWPDFDTLASDRWLVITFQARDGRFDMADGYSGRGTILARGKFEVKKKNFRWDGVILSGEELNLKEEGTVVEGAVIGGLNAVTGGDGKKVDIDKKNTRVQYNSCHARTGSRILFRHLAVAPGSWSETF